MFIKTKRVLLAALMLGAASGALAGDGSGYGDGAGMRPPARAVQAPRARRQITPRGYGASASGANAYQQVPVRSWRSETEWPRMNCDLPIGC